MGTAIRPFAVSLAHHATERAAECSRAPSSKRGAFSGVCSHCQYRSSRTIRSRRIEHTVRRRPQYLHFLEVSTILGKEAHREETAQRAPVEPLRLDALQDRRDEKCRAPSAGRRALCTHASYRSDPSIHAIRACGSSTRRSRSAHRAMTLSRAPRGDPVRTHPADPPARRARRSAGARPAARRSRALRRASARACSPVRPRSKRSMIPAPFALRATRSPRASGAAAARPPPRTFTWKSAKAFTRPAPPCRALRARALRDRW